MKKQKKVYSEDICFKESSICSQLYSSPCPSLEPKRGMGPNCADGVNVEVWRLLMVGRGVAEGHRTP